LSRRRGASEVRRDIPQWTTAEFVSDDAKRAIAAGPGMTIILPGHIAGQGDVAAKLKCFCVVYVNLVASAVDEDFGAIGREAEGKAMRPSNSFLLMSLRVFMSKAKTRSGDCRVYRDSDGVADG